MRVKKQFGYGKYPSAAIAFNSHSFLICRRFKTTPSTYEFWQGKS